MSMLSSCLVRHFPSISLFFGQKTKTKNQKTKNQKNQRKTREKMTKSDRQRKKQKILTSWGRVRNENEGQEENDVCSIHGGSCRETNKFASNQIYI